MTEPSLLGDAGDLEIRIRSDPDNGIITITYAIFFEFHFLSVDKYAGKQFNLIFLNLQRYWHWDDERGVS